MKKLITLSIIILSFFNVKAQLKPSDFPTGIKFGTTGGIQTKSANLVFKDSAINYERRGDILYKYVTFDVDSARIHDFFDTLLISNPGLGKVIVVDNAIVKVIGGQREYDQMSAFQFYYRDITDTSFYTSFINNRVTEQVGIGTGTKTVFEYQTLGEHVDNGDTAVVVYWGTTRIDLTNGGIDNTIANAYLDYGSGYLSVTYKAGHIPTNGTPIYIRYSNRISTDIKYPIYYRFLYYERGNFGNKKSFQTSTDWVLLNNIDGEFKSIKQYDYGNPPENYNGSDFIFTSLNVTQKLAHSFKSNVPIWFLAGNFKYGICCENTIGNKIFQFKVKYHIENL